MYTDTIADMLTRIRNAIMANHERVEVPSSRVKKMIITILREEGYIKNFKVVEDEGKEKIIVYLKYVNEEPVIRGLDRISKPSRRVYSGKDDIPVVLGGYGIAIISTSQGIMTGKKAAELGIGGEVLCKVW
ncbi:MAG: 30S ribosomal protein S8 [Acidobacteria bacterium CG_4_9_14_3_um_filter_49_7]|jgi:small subunit ribosomal protein S8|nr:MAG: 30S ribosomal protein S8 [Acidobacteria bacterium CG_4_9_14_3_um_filter_49_7]